MVRFVLLGGKGSGQGLESNVEEMGARPKSTTTRPVPATATCNGLGRAWGMDFGNWETQRLQLTACLFLLGASKFVSRLVRPSRQSRAVTNTWNGPGHVHASWQVPPLGCGREMRTCQLHDPQLAIWSADLSRLVLHLPYCVPTLHHFAVDSECLVLLSAII